MKNNILKKKNMLADFIFISLILNSYDLVFKNIFEVPAILEKQRKQ